MIIVVPPPNLPELQRRLGRYIQQMPLVVMAALKQEAEVIMTESKRQCPVDTGALRASGFVEEPILHWGGSITIMLGYGGRNVKINPRTGELTTKYAIKVHENPPSVQAHRVGNFKFLERPVMANAPVIVRHLVTRINILAQATLGGAP